jgi:hypothetical protein
MSLVQVAMFSWCLLASNNPSTLRGILAADVGPEVLPENDLKWLPLVYSKSFKVAWLWNRGREKYKWLARITLRNEIIISEWEYTLMGVGAV